MKAMLFLRLMGNYFQMNMGKEARAVVSRGGSPL